MKTKEEIEQLAKQSAQKKYRLQHIPLELIDEYGGEIASHVSIFSDAYTQCQQDMADMKYTEEDMLNASKYGYEFRDTTSFPEHKFEDSCIRNTKQWIYSLNKQDNEYI